MQRFLAVLLAVAFLGTLTACGGRPQTTVDAQGKVDDARVTPTVPPGQDSLPGAAISTRPEDIARLPIGITEGRFSHEVYETQTGSTRLALAIGKGPYQLAIDRLLQPVDLPESGNVEIGLTVETPGEYRMTLTWPGESQPIDTAMLNVRPVGTR